MQICEKTNIMKKILAYIFLSAFCIYSNAQIIKPKNLDAGQCLQRSANNFYAGLGLTAVSAVVLALPDFEKNTATDDMNRFTSRYTTSASAAKSNPSLTLVSQEEYNRRIAKYQEDANKDHHRLNYIIGGAFGIGAIVCYINGIRYIKVAGKKMHLQSTQNTVGLIMKF